ncbi:MAG: hypothetical protein K0Q64_2434 [Nitrobacter vulgaris]|nr:hypothetical protein [Nitrobacter vulgaris]
MSPCSNTRGWGHAGLPALHGTCSPHARIGWVRPICHVTSRCRLLLRAGAALLRHECCECASCQFASSRSSRPPDYQRVSRLPRLHRCKDRRSAPRGIPVPCARQPSPEIGRTAALLTPACLTICRPKTTYTTTDSRSRPGRPSSARRSVRFAQCLQR